jgi:two-component system sensor histidine kinase KdpD
VRASGAPADLALLGLSHELRAPVGAIAVAAAGLRLATGEAERDRLLDALVGETQRLDRILANLLDLWRLQAGEVRARLVRCSPERLATDALAAAEAVTGGAEVRVEVEDGCPPVLADPFLTERILVNLLHNAVRHGRPPVTLRAAPGGDRVDLTVRDDGPGVDPARAASLFRAFVDPPATGGLGVGLRLSHGLAAAQGADLRMIPVARGACFALGLRVAVQLAAA